MGIGTLPTGAIYKEKVKIALKFSYSCTSYSLAMVKPVYTTFLHLLCLWY